MTNQEVLDILNKKTRYPKFEEKKEHWELVYYGMSLHTLGAVPSFKDLGTGRIIKPAGYYGTQYQNLFNYTLLNRHPRESDETRMWRLSQYRPMTKAPFSRITEIVTGAMFQDGNYSLTIPKQEDSDYIWGNNFYGYNFIQYWQKIGYKCMVEDPNGYFVRIPKYRFDEQEENGVNVQIWFVNSKDIKYKDKDNIIFYKDGYCYHIDEQLIFRYKEEKNQYTTEEPYYAHMLGYLPVSIAGGEWNSMGYYDSFYDKAKAAADEFVSAYSAKQLVEKEASYPYITEAADDCADCQGSGKISQQCDDCDGGWEVVPCRKCGGKGVLPSDPARRRIVPIEDMAKTKLIQIENPDTSINKHHSDNTDKIMTMILDALHLTVITEAQSGAAKAIDQERLNQFISTISNHLFDTLITDSLNDIISYRNVQSNGGMLTPAKYDYTLVKPSQFNIKTAQDLLEEYKTATEAKLPDYILAQQATDYVDKQYSGNDVLKKKSDYITATDKILFKTSAEITDLRLTGGISIQDVQYHLNVSGMIDEIIRNKGDEWFINAKFEAIAVEIETLKPKYYNATGGIQQTD